MPELTALRRAGPGRIVLEVDGRPWRTVPDEVVLRAGLAAGLELDRPTRRRLSDELARARALGLAGRALARGDLSSKRLVGRLEGARVGERIAADVVAGLQRAGVADDRRSALSRACALARRGWGDAAVAARLDAEGFDEAHVRVALDALEPEAERARALVAKEPDRHRAGRLLARRGFAPETAEDVLGLD